MTRSKPPARRPRSGALLVALLLTPVGYATAAEPQSNPEMASRVRVLEAQVHDLTTALRSLQERLASIQAADVGPLRTEAGVAATRPSVRGSPPVKNVASVSPAEQSLATPSSSASANIPGVPFTAAASARVAARQAGATGMKAETIFEGGTPTTAAVAAIEGGRPVIESADGQFTVNLLGVMNLDAADYRQPSAGPLSLDFRRGGSPSDSGRARDLSSGSDFRRARLGLGGRAFGDFQYSFLYEFGGSGGEDAGHIQELWVQYSGVKPFFLRAGAFAPFIGLEDAGSTNGSMFLERPSSAEIARSVAGADFREALQLVAESPRLFASAALTGRLVGTINSTGSATAAPYDSQLGAVGRLAAIAYKDDSNLVHLGLHGSYVVTPADATGPDGSSSTPRYAIELRDRPELRVDGTRLIDTGAIDAAHAATVGFEIAAQHGPFLIQGEGEYIKVERRASSLANPDFHGGYVEASWMLTGEKRAYNAGNSAFDGPRLQHYFSIRDHSWGAFELAIRYSEIDLNFSPGGLGTNPLGTAVRGGDQTVLSAGLNWYLNPVARLMFDWDHVRVDRLSPNAMLFGTPAGAQIGQSYDAPAARLQLAF